MVYLFLRFNHYVQCTHCIIANTLHISRFCSLSDFFQQQDTACVVVLFMIVYNVFVWNFKSVIHQKFSAEGFAFET